MIAALTTFLALAAAGPAKAESSKLIFLRNSVEPLTLQFNEQRDRPRLVAILSPT